MSFHLNVPDALFVREDPKPADIAIVFGHKEEQTLKSRTLRAISLFEDELVPKLVFTGGGTPPEAKRMASIAENRGLIQNEDFLIEEKSTTSGKNVTHCKRLLQDFGMLDGIHRILLVSSEWHMARLKILMRRVFSPGMELICCPTIAGIDRDNWKASKRNALTLGSELGKLCKLLLEDQIETADAP